MWNAALPEFVIVDSSSPIPPPPALAGGDEGKTDVKCGNLSKRVS
tara:strand:+ start:972 stop:1106 length:135 start_codon:yes stop_codon:yes gene_type:complete